MTFHDELNEIRKRAGLKESQNPAEDLVRLGENMMSGNFSAWLAELGPNTVSMDQLKASPRGSGHVSKFMQAFTHLADSLGVHLVIEVDDSEDEDRLMRWYSKFGFEIAPSNRMGLQVMERKPR